MELLVGNPVHVYSLLDRLVRGLPGLLAGVSSQLGERINLVTGAGHLAQLGLGDVEAAGQALVRVQFAYRCPVSAPPLLTSCWCRLDPADLARGLICGVQTGARLSSQQMVDIARSRCGAQPGGLGVEVETKVHTKVRNHCAGPYCIKTLW